MLDGVLGGQGRAAQQELAGEGGPVEGAGAEHGSGRGGTGGVGRLGRLGLGRRGCHGRRGLGRRGCRGLLRGALRHAAHASGACGHLLSATPTGYRARRARRGRLPRISCSVITRDVRSTREAAAMSERRARPASKNGRKSAWRRALNPPATPPAEPPAGGPTRRPRNRRTRPASYRRPCTATAYASPRPPPSPTRSGSCATSRPAWRGSASRAPRSPNSSPWPRSSTCIRSPSRLSKVADLAEAAGSNRVRFTPYQKLIILDVADDKFDELRDGLDALGLPARPSHWRRNLMACTGIEFCKLSFAETRMRARGWSRSWRSGWRTSTPSSTSRSP